MVDYIETDTSGMETSQALQKTAKAQGFNSDTTQAFIDNYDGEMSIPEYTQQFLNYHNLGRTLSPYNTLNPNSYTIANNARYAAYESGKNIYVANAKLDNMLTEAQQRWKNESKGYKTGAVDTSKIEGVQLTQNQKDSVKYISRYSKVGLNIEFYQSSPNAKGRYTSPNGWYNSATHTIGIDINAGRASINEALKNGAMLTTFSHELTHIAEHAPEEYTALREAVMNTVGAEAWEEAVSKQYNNLKNNHSEQYKDMSDEQIREAAAKEALAEACSDMLKKADVLEQMIEENPKYAERFINFIKKVVKALRNLRTRILQDSTIAKEEAKLLEEKADDLQSIVDKYSAAVKEGIKNQNARTAVKSDTEQSGNVQEQGRDNKSSFNKHAVSTAIWEALDHKDMGHDNLIKVGEMPKYIQSLLGITGDFYIQRNHTYENTVTERQAKEDGRYSSKAHYHGYGVNKMERAMLSIEHPIMTINTKTNDGNPTVIMLLDEYGNNNTPLYAVLSFYSNKLINGRNDIKPHVVLTIAEREWYAKNGRTGYNEIIGNAIKEKRVIDFDKKKRGELSEVAQTTSLGSITESSLNKSLSQFRKEINSYKNKNNIQYQDRNLVAVHNLNANELEKSLELGGLAMPSIAVVKDDFAHTEYGDVSVLFSRDTIDPEVNRDNKVYGGDAWTPTYPSLEYKLNSKKSQSIYRKVNNIGQIPFFNPSNFHPVNLEDTVNRLGNETLVEKYKKDYGLKNAFLKDTTGEYVKIGKKETVTRLSDEDISEYTYLADKMPKDMFEDIKRMDGRDWIKKYRDKFEEIRSEYIKTAFPEITDEELENIFISEKGFRVVQKARKIYNFIENGAETKTTSDDIEGAEAEIDRKVNDNEYEKWLNDLFDGVIEKSGIYNGKDPYTSYGDRKSFEQLHYEETLENVVKVMKQQANGEGALFSGLGLWGVAAKNYGTIEELKQDENRLQTMDEEEYSKIKNQFGERFTEIAASIVEHREGQNEFIEMDNAFENILGAVRNCKTKSGMLRELRSYYSKTTNATIDDILDLIADVGNMPTEYFEAKPQRAVGLDEIKAVVLPDNASNTLKSKLKESNIPFFEYKAGDNESRKTVTQQAYDTEYTDIKGEKHNDIRFQDREHLTTEDELIEKATQSPIDFELDDDLFEEEEQDIDFENMISDDPQLAMELMYKQLAKQSHEVVRFGRDKTLKDIAYRRIANKIINDYSIERSHLEELTDKVKQFIENNTEASFADDFKNFVLDMRQSLLYSNVLDENRDERRRAVRDTVKGQTLIIPESAEAEIRSEYESVRNYANILFGYGITVSLRNNTGFMTNTSYSTVNDIITDIQEQTGEMINNDTDGEDAYIELERFLSDILSPKYNNPYLDGILENIDIAAVEVASDVMTEYTHQLGLVTTHIDSKQTKKLNNQLDIIKAQRDKLLRAAKESSKLNNDLTKYKKRLDTLQADTDKLDEVNWLIEANNEDETLLDQRAELENKVEEDRKALMRLKTTRPIQKVVDRQIKRAVQAERDKQREIIKRNRSRYAEELNELKDKNYNKLNEYRNARKLSEVVDNIGVLQRKMARALRNPTENVYVPEAFSTVYIDVCDAITEALNNGKVTQVNVKLLQLQSELRKLNNSSTEYEGEISEQLFNNLEYVVQLAQLLDNRLEQLDGRPITKKTISLREANDIYNVLFEIYHTVQDATKQLGREDKRTNLSSGAQIDEDMKGAKKFADKTKLENYKDKFKSNVLNGVRLSRYYSGYNDNSEIMYHVNALNEGQRKANVYKMNAEKKFLELTEKRKKDYKRSLSEVVEVKYKLNNGKDASVKLTRMTALQALMTWTREQTSSNLVHMERSGMVLPDADLMAKGKVKEALEKSTRVDRVNTSLVVALENTLTDFEQDYRAIAEEYFNKYAKKAINEVSNVIKHRSIAMSEYYIPITVDSNYLVNELEELKFDATLEGMGMLKSTVPRSNLPIIMTSLNNVIARHINDTSKLYGLAIPTRNFKKALNVSFTDTNENGDKIKTGSVRDTIKQVWGDRANDFFNRLIADLESSRNKDNNANKDIQKAIGGLRKAMVIKTLTGNISVVIKQAASYPTAGLYLNTSSLMKELAKAANLVKPGNYQKLIDEIDEHTAQHYMRRLGMSQPEINEFLNSWARNIPTALNPAKWIQGVDCLTTALLWNATKEDVKSQYQKSGKAVNTDEYWKDVTDLYDKVIEDTQPMYDSLHRSELQKNTNEVWKSVFMFKTQPLQNTGIIYDSIGNAMAHPKDKAAFKTATKAVTSQVVSLSVFAGMSFAAALLLNRLRRYKDDDGELTLESIMKTIFHDMLINGAGVFEPLFGNEIAEFIESTITKKGRYDTFSMPVVDMLNDTISAIQTTYDEVVKDIDRVKHGVPINTEKLFQTFKDDLIEVTGLFGIPAQNISNLLNAFLSRVGINILAQQDNRRARDYIKSYGDNYLNGNTEKAKEQLKTLYKQEYDKNILKGKERDEAHKAAFSSVRSKLSSTYKLDYQKAFLSGDDKTQTDITNILSKSGYMVFEKSRMLSDVLSDWRENAKKDVDNSYNN